VSRASEAKLRWKSYDFGKLVLLSEAKRTAHCRAATLPKRTSCSRSEIREAKLGW